MSENKDQCKEEFEAWCNTRNNAPVRLKGTDQYVALYAQVSWASWQAAWNRRPTEPQQAVALPVKPWEQRMEEYYAKGSGQMLEASAFQLEEIADWRASVQAVALSDEHPDYEVHCNGEFCAGASGKNAHLEILHYASQYEQDGEVEIFKVTRTKIDLSILAAQKEKA